MSGTGAAPDPLRDYFIRGARQLLSRAYARPGEWVGTRLADPDPVARAVCARMGIDPFAADNVSAIGGRKGGLNARTRWMRAYVRCLYDQHKWWAANHGPTDGWRTEKRMVPLESGALEVDVGFRVPALGVIPAGRAIRIRIRRGGQVKMRAVGRLGERDRIWVGDREQGQRFSDPALRDW